MSLRLQVTVISCFAALEVSSVSTVHPTVLRLKMSRMTYRYNQMRVAWPTSREMSHDHTWFGLIANNRGGL